MKVVVPRCRRSPLACVFVCIVPFVGSGWPSLTHPPAFVRLMRTRAQAKGKTKGKGKGKAKGKSKKKKKEE